ncbi:MetQ/NlpA family ABC transporter substrate-binding protein [Vibrio natriegens]|uniref:Lipoprotein n=1 Tax=Vibrio natriegens NBRC 15636 = ATCC 14048 = DSM 759 TaxID=1219067 RepID=A0AAN0Y0K9_VIBNA|nr:MetQ/NlpA family ABC transporter substrate-binding protein [Vibrio natriegens]ALR16555.1 methionine ABC transporter substrate-binding protein [Vibrio natriegens NBRC 15636 = ATCC 14048 = DSM 759]ANQ11579.1 methionine ABC transporter substrate-binding protein [Vibrio natriegens NBRC 15636 = ATCC 14048 = DSM 759]EPM39137.1 ABC transporter substrate-binding protein [Vibrio natriegens NBRC 15636 = ATCC 14048 = DSM 759]MDX6025917.1 MetQ/NlpA family ABC transporter substrate-binding protein [Vibri
MESFSQIKQLPFIFIAALSLAACGQKEDSVIKVGATVGPHAQVVEAVAKEAEKQGLKVEVVEFSDYVTPNAALSDGSIDINSYQHQPFLDNFNNSHNAHLVSIGQSILMRMGVYSNKFRSLEDLPENARIAIPNDPTNGGRGLLLLADAGLITLRPGVGHKAALTDITENPKAFQFIEVDAAQLPRTLDDVDAATITMNYVMSSGLDPKKQGIYLESKEAPLAVMVIATREADKNKEEYKKFVSIYQSQEIRDFLDKTFKGTIEPAF